MNEENRTADPIFSGGNLKLLGQAEGCCDTARQVRKFGLIVGDTIVGREGGKTWWQESRLTLIFVGAKECVWNIELRSDSSTEWSKPEEASNWTLSCRDWYLVQK